MLVLLMETSPRRYWAPWVLLDEVSMKKEEVAKVVVRYPILLTTKADDARAAIHWLCERAGLSPRQVIFSQRIALRCWWVRFITDSEELAERSARVGWWSIS